MKKLKIVLGFLLVLLVAGLGAVLPIMLPEPDFQMQYEPIANMPYLESEGRGPMTMPEKMQLFRFGGQGVHVQEDAMTSSRDKVLKAAEKIVAQWQALGLIPGDMELYEKRVRPLMVFSTGTGEDFNLFWELYLSYRNKAHHLTVSLMMDDEENKVLTVYAGSVHCNLTELDGDSYVRRFAEQYFTALGIDNYNEIANGAGQDSVLYCVPLENGTAVCAEFYYMWGADGDSFGIYIMSFEDVGDLLEQAETDSEEETEGAMKDDTDSGS